VEEIEEAEEGEEVSQPQPPQVEDNSFAKQIFSGSLNKPRGQEVPEEEQKIDIGKMMLKKALDNGKKHQLEQRIFKTLYTRFPHPGVGKEKKKELEEKMEDKQMKVLDKLKIGQFLVKKMTKDEAKEKLEEVKSTLSKDAIFKMFQKDIENEIKKLKAEGIQTEIERRKVERSKTPSSSRNDNANPRFSEDSRTPVAGERIRDASQSNTKRSDSRTPPPKEAFQPEATQKMINMIKKHEDNEFEDYSPSAEYTRKNQQNSATISAFERGRTTAPANDNRGWVAANEKNDLSDDEFNV